MQKLSKPLGIFSLILMNTVIVGSLQMLTFTAIYGYSLFLFYAIATITFFIPSILITAELATSWPVTGGPFIWVEHAFGKTMGFYTICILWFCNLVWYPTIFSLIVTGVFYLFDPQLANHKLYMFFGITSMFWFMTLLNCLGIRVSNLVSSISSVAGIIIPTFILLGLAAFWIFSGKPSQITLNKASLLPDLKHIGNIAFLTQIIISLTGIEVSSVHAGDVEGPRRDYPIALFYSIFVILFVLIGTALSIAIVIPAKNIGLVSGMLDAATIFVQSFHLPWVLFILLLLITLGNFGCASSWMISSTRGMSVACHEIHTHRFLQKVNRFNAPAGILILEAIIFTVASMAYWLMPSVNASYWLLLEMTSLVGLVYYIILFASAVRLRYKDPQKERHFKIPGGNWGIWLVAMMGGLASLFGIVVGFVPPDQAGVGSTFSYVMSLSLGMLFALVLPFALLKIVRNKERA